LSNACLEMWRGRNRSIMALFPHPPGQGQGEDLPLNGWPDLWNRGDLPKTDASSWSPSYRRPARGPRPCKSVHEKPGHLDGAPRAGGPPGIKRGQTRDLQCPRSGQSRDASPRQGSLCGLLGAKTGLTRKALPILENLSSSPSQTMIRSGPRQRGKFYPRSRAVWASSGASSEFVAGRRIFRSGTWTPCAPTSRSQSPTENIKS
jgi:hypothetical protein